MAKLTVKDLLDLKGVPVIAHVGLVPPKVTWVGGMRALGRTAVQAGQVYHDAKAFEVFRNTIDLSLKSL